MNYQPNMGFLTSKTQSMVRITAPAVLMEHEITLPGSPRDVFEKPQKFMRTPWRGGMGRLRDL
jgi:hypothetical protein